MNRTPTAEKESPVDFIKRRVEPDGAQAERRAFEQQWWASIAVYSGIKFVADGNSVRPSLNLLQQKQEYNANLVLPKVLRFLAKLQSINPRIVVLPNSGSWEDMQAAKLSEQAIEHAQQVSSWEDARDQALLWAVIAGFGIVKVCFDPHRGTANRIYREKNGQPNPMIRFSSELRSMYDRAGLFVDVYPGEVTSHAVEPWQFWWDPNGRSGGINSCQWVATVIARPVDEIWTETGVRVEPDSNTLRGAEQYREAFAFMASGQTGIIPNVLRPRMGDCAREIELFHVPSNRYPKGRRTRLVGAKVIDDGDNPYVACGMPLPFVKYDAFPCVGRFPGLSLVDQLRNPQRAYNESRGHAMNMQRTAGHAPIFLEKGAGITPARFPGVPGVVLEVPAGSRPPTFGQPPQMPPYIGQNAEWASREMGEISAQTDPAQAKVPGQLRSGSAIQAVQADSNLILTPTVKSMFKADTIAATMMLQLIGMFYEEQRVITVLGPGGEIDPKYLKGSDLRQHYRVKILAQPGDLESAESRVAQLMDAAQLKILNPENPEHQILLLKGLRFHTSDEFVNAILQQENSEQRAMARMVEHPEVEEPVYPWYDPMIRAKVLERRLNSREWELYPPQVQAVFMQRWGHYTQLIAERVAAQLEAQAQANGTPAEKGQASQPSR